MLRVHVEEAAHAELTSGLDALVAEGARQMLAAALEAEVEAYVSSLIHEVDEIGRRLVVRNGHAESRSLVTGAGPLEVQAPRVNDRRVDEETGERMRFRSSILPPWARKSPKVAEVLPLMYLHGMSSGDFAPALEEFFGSAAGLSASVITRLTTDWQREREQFARRSLKEVDYVYVYADGIHFNVRLQEARLCVLVIVGVRADGTKDWSRSPTDTASRPSRGPTCSATSNVGACGRRCSRSATVHWAFGAPSPRSFPTPRTNGVGSTKWRTV
jgi:transposase-like protein